jgi:DNA-binding MarR family transcriptional regulator
MTAGDDGPRDTAITLGVLSAIERDSAITQRCLSNELGIALGLANAYLKRCVRKGWIKVSQAPLNRYAYYLTPHGFAEKSRLTGEFLRDSLKFFRTARRSLTALFIECRARGLGRLALAGAGELAEIAVLSAADVGLHIDHVVDARAAGTTCAGRPVRAALAVDAIDAVVITDTEAPQAAFDAMLAAAAAAGLAAEAVLAPSVLRVSAAPATVPDLPAAKAEPA